MQHIKKYAAFLVMVLLFCLLLTGSACADPGGAADGADAAAAETCVDAPDTAEAAETCVDAPDVAEAAETCVDAPDNAEAAEPCGTESDVTAAADAAEACGDTGEVSVPEAEQLPADTEEPVCAETAAPDNAEAAETCGTESDVTAAADAAEACGDTDEVSVPETEQLPADTEEPVCTETTAPDTAEAAEPCVDAPDNAEAAETCGTEPDVTDAADSSGCGSSSNVVNDAEGPEAKRYIAFDGKYRLYSGESADLGGILDSLGIDRSGGISSVTCSDPEAVLLGQDGDGYILTGTGKGFADEVLYVTIGGVEYAVPMHDPDEYEAADFDNLSFCLQNCSDSEIILVSDIVLEDNITTDRANTLDLNGHVLKAGVENMGILKIDYTGNLIIIDSSIDKTGKIDFDSKAAYIENYGSFSLEGIALMNYCDSIGQGAVRSYSSVLNIDDCRVQDCSSKEGGAVYVDSGVADIRNSTFTGCSADKGGAICITGGGQLLMGGVTFEDCSAGQNGGAIYCDGSSVLAVIDKMTVTGCTAGSDGGALFNGNGIVALFNSTVTGCSAGSDGGAICNAGSGHIELHSVTFKNCSAGINGGAVFNGDSAVLDITGKTTITGCSSKSGGGGISSVSASSFVNIVPEGGAAVVIAGNTGAEGVPDDIMYSTKENVTFYGSFTDSSRIGLYTGASYLSAAPAGTAARGSKTSGNLDTVFFSDDLRYTISYDDGDGFLYFVPIDEETGSTVAVVPVTDRYVYGSDAKVSFYTNSDKDGKHPAISLVSDSLHEYVDEWTFKGSGIWYVTISCKNNSIPESAGGHSVTVSGGPDQTPATLTYWVLPKEVSLEWTGDSFTYDGLEHAPTVSMTGILDCDIGECAVKLSDRSTGKNVGNYTAAAVLYGARSGNYILPDNYKYDFSITEDITDDEGTAAAAFPKAADPAGAGSTSASAADTGKAVTVSCTVFGDTAMILVKDEDGNAVFPDKITIVSAAGLVADGAKTAEFRLTGTLTVEIDLKSAMGGKKDCVITIENNNGTVTVKRDGEVIFEADISDITDRVARLVYDGKTVKAIDEDGRVIAEFDVY